MLLWLWMINLLVLTNFLILDHVRFFASSKYYTYCTYTDGSTGLSVAWHVHSVELPILRISLTYVRLLHSCIYIRSLLCFPLPLLYDPFLFSSLRIHDRDA